MADAIVIDIPAAPGGPVSAVVETRQNSMEINRVRTSVTGQSGLVLTFVYDGETVIERQSLGTNYNVPRGYFLDALAPYSISLESP